MTNDPDDHSVPLWKSRGAALGAWVVVFAGVIVFYAQERWLAVMSLLLSDGALAMIWVGCAGMLGAWLLKRFRIEALRSLWLATAVGLGMGLFGLIVLGLGLAGALNRASILLMMLVSAILGGIELYQTYGSSLKEPVGLGIARWLAQPAGWNWCWLIAAPCAAMAVVGASMLPGMLWKPDDPHPYDVLIYHLQVPREWFELGRIVALPHNVYSFFPFNVEMHYLAAMYLKGGPWAGMYTAQFLSLVMAGVFVWTVRVCAGVPAAVLAAVIPWTITTSCVCYVESGLLMYSMLAIGWVLQSLAKSDAVTNWKSWALAGIFCGFAAGVKLTALPMLAGGLGIGTLIMCFRASTVRGLAVFSIATILAISPWLARNWAWSGNPVFPLAMNALGSGHYSPRQVERFNRAHAPPPAQQSLAARAMAAGEQIVSNWRYGFVLWPLSILAIVLNWRDRQRWVLLIALLVMLGVWMFATHLISRFFVIAIASALALIGRDQRNVMRTIVSIFAALVLGICVFGEVHPQLWHFARLGDSGLFGLEDFSFLNAPELEKWRESGGVLYKVGDSQAFIMQTPMSRLRYRSPFDVDDSKGDALQAWLGEGVDRSKVWMLIDPPELQRLHKNYGTPIPAEAKDRVMPFLIAPTGVFVAK